MASPIVQTNSTTAVVSSTATGQNVTVAKPSGTVDGELLVAFVSTGADPGQSAPATVPSGWTLITGGNNADAGLYAYYKVASGEPASWNWNWTSTGNQQFRGASCLRISGQNAGLITDGSASAGSLGTSLSFANTISPTITSDLLVMALCGDNSVVSGQAFSGYGITTSNPSPWTQQVFINGQNGGGTVEHSLGIATAVRPQTGATGNSVATASLSLSKAEGVLIAVTRNNISATSVSDTETATDAVNAMRRRSLSVSDTETATDAVNATKSHPWANQSKNPSAWTDQTKH